MMKKYSRIKFIVIASAMFFLYSFGVKIFCFNDTEYSVTITDKERITESSKDSGSASKYFVFVDDENGNSLVFENMDCFMRWKFNSSNLQGKLKEGNTYKITVIWYRVPFLSWYQNIIKAEELHFD